MIKRNDLEIERTLRQLNKQLESKKFKGLKVEVKEGLREAARVLRDKDEDITHIANNCDTVRGRFIAWLAVDYLQGKRTREDVLLVFRTGK